MAEIIESIIRILAFGWWIISPLVCILWSFNTGMCYRFMERHWRTAFCVFFGCFTSLVIVLGEGLQALLIFIPKNWGDYNEDGAFVTFRSSIAYVFAVALSYFFFYNAIGVRSLQEQLSIIEEIKKRKRRLPVRRQSLINTRNRIKTEYEQLRDRSFSLSTEEKRELQVLSGLLVELQYLIRVARPSDKG